MKCVTSLPPVDLFEGRLEVASVHHVVDSRINSSFPRSRRLTLLRWGCQNLGHRNLGHRNWGRRNWGRRNFLLFFYHILFGHGRSRLVFAFAIPLRPGLFGSLGLALNRRSWSRCRDRLWGRSSDRWWSRGLFDNGGWRRRDLSGFRHLVRSVRSLRFPCRHIMSDKSSMKENKTDLSSMVDPRLEWARQ